MMKCSNLVDLCNDDFRESVVEQGRKEKALVSATIQVKENNIVKKIWLEESESQPRQDKENRRADAFSTRRHNINMLSYDSYSVDWLSIPSSPPIFRHFWKAGNYEMEGQVSKTASQSNGKNHLLIHPMFLHSNATSHKWVFGAIAELLDNSVDEIQNGATFVLVDKITNPRDGTPALLIQDDGGGMDPEAIRHCMSFGFSKRESQSSIGQYGNGFKTSSMRLGADVIVFSRHWEKGSLTQSVGLLSYTFLRQAAHDRIVLPVVDYEFNTTTKTFVPIFCHGKEHFSSNLSMLLQWSPYSMEEELLKFDDIGQHGTKIVIYILWLNNDGSMELDFDSDIEDIRISGDQKLFQAGNQMKPVYDQHMANQYKFSLRVYASILYLRLPDSFRIFLRGRVIEHHNIANDLKYPEFILYRPNGGGNMEAIFVTTIGFLKEAPHVNIHGFNIYHRNRLILPFWPVLKVANGTGRGVVGVLEANYIQPTHNKQDFEKTSLFQKLEDRLKHMIVEYWHLHCELIGYQKIKRAHAAPLPSFESQTSTYGRYQEQPVLMKEKSPKISRVVPITVGLVEDPVATTLEGSRRYTDTSAARSLLGIKSKRKDSDPAVDLQYAKKHIGDEIRATDIDCVRNGQTNRSIEKPIGVEEMRILQENKKLRSRLSELEKRERELIVKVTGSRRGNSLFAKI
ncbi:protein MICRORCHIDIA 6 [Quillaja saponaria]|uniref:Protein MICRORCHIDIA 6 n=1 Tax=Quillaja saponaria TaxID=32244 RepID=A0AAD7M6D5_QUISA|nr:protein MICRORCHIDIA 6 [Quillaja saponaria]KAJ7970806.1 protein MICRORCHIDIA 6 [Quillaja saponaria]